MKVKNITLVGTSHIAEQSLLEVSNAFSKVKPDIVALELDRQRLFALVHKVKTSVSPTIMFKIGVSGYIFLLIGRYMQEKLGKVVRIQPGSDMLAAYNLAKENHKQVALVDQDIAITLKRLSAALTWKIKFRFLKDLLTGVMGKKISVKGTTLSAEQMQFDLKSIPEKDVIKQMIGFVKQRYPPIYRVLVHERNVHMARNLIRLTEKFPEKKILAVVGAGHEDGMIKIIKSVSTGKMV